MVSSMSRRMCALAFGALGLMWFVACTPGLNPSSKQGAGLRSPTVALMDFPKDGAFSTDNFYDFPYPHDARLDKDGSPALAAFPAPKRKKQCAPPVSKEPFLKQIISSIDADDYVTDIVKVTDTQTQGFGLNPTITLRFTRAIHKDALPSAAVSLSDSAPVFLVDVDPKSPQLGRRVPLLLRSNLKSRFLPDKTLIARPVPGFVLLPKTTYALVVRTSVRDDGGWPLGASKLLLDLSKGRGDKGLQQHYAPLFAYLKAQKIALEEVAAATVLTTGDPTAQLQKIRDFIRAKMPAPAGPSSIECSESASAPYVTCIGRFASPLFQKGEAPFLGKEIGFFEYDKDGNPTYRMKSLRFALSIPKRYLHDGSLTQHPLPIVMYAHGTGGTYRTFINNGTARKLAEMGIAGFGIDQAVNGERTIDLGGQRMDFLFFNALNLPAARDNVRQSAADYYWQVRFLKSLKVNYKDRSFGFDPKRMWFMGHSQGGLTGPLVLAFEDDIRGAYLSAPGGYIIHTLLYKTKPAEPILLSTVLQYMLCEENPQDIDGFHPILGLVQHFFDPADPVNYAPLILKGKRSPINLLMTEGLTDGYAPPEVFDPLAIAMGLPLLGTEHSAIPGLHLQQMPTYSLPVRGNFLHSSGKRTTVGFTQHKLCEYTSGNPCDGHFVAFYNDDARRNWLTFFQSMVYDDVAQIH